MFNKTQMVGCVAALCLMSSQAVNAALLPAPGTIIDGVPVSVQYGDFYSYSIPVLNYLQPTEGWKTSAGTGTLDVIITTRSAGQSNSGGSLAPYNIPDPITNTNTNPITGTWGDGGTASTTMLVSDLYAYLQDTFQANVPIFTFDQNETGGNPDLFALAKVEIFSAGGVLIEDWILGDGINPVLAPGQICIDPDSAGVTCFSNNVGSGAFDYLIYAPTMDLSLYDDPGNIFKVTWTFSEVDDGGEEITLTGRFTGSICVETPDAPQCQTVPEPGSLALIGGALLAALGLRRRRISA